MNRSDGSTADYYVLPEGATQLQDLISHRNMNAQIGEIIRACYRYGMASHSDMLRDAKKIRFYAQAEVERLEKLASNPLRLETIPTIILDGSGVTAWDTAPSFADILIQHQDDMEMYWANSGTGQCKEIGEARRCTRVVYPSEYFKLIDTRPTSTSK